MLSTDINYSMIRNSKDRYMIKTPNSSELSKSYTFEYIGNISDAITFTLPNITRKVDIRFDNCDCSFTSGTYSIKSTSDSII